MASRILQTLSTIQKNFPEDWLSAYDFNQTGDRERLNKVIQDTLDAVFQNFYTSVLSGEYDYHKDFFISLQDLQSFLNSNFDSIVIENISENHEDTQILFESKIKNGFRDVIKILIEGYKTFYTLLEAYEKYPNYEIVSVKNAILENLFLSQEKNEEVKDKIGYFFQLIKLNEFEHFFSDSVSFFKSLISLESDIISNRHKTPFRYNNLLKEKVQFLKFKWQVRQRTLYKLDNTFIQQSYISEQTLNSFADIPRFSTESSELNEWVEHLEITYEIGDWELKLISKVDKIDQENLPGLKVRELHLLIKYYKDIAKSYDNLSEVVDEIKKRYQEEKSDKNVYRKIYHYAINNQFSLLLEVQHVHGQQVKELKQKIDKFQINTKLDNFFVDFKYIDYSLKKVEESFKNRAEFDSVQKSKEYLDEIEKLIDAGVKKLAWSNKYYYSIFQLPFEESRIECDLEGLSKVYYPSTFLLPFSQRESEFKFNLGKIKFNKYSALVESINSLKKEFNSISSMKDDLKKHDVKSIEIIGIFTAIVTFVMATVPSFKFVNDLRQAALFTLTIASSLFLFVFILLTFVRGNKSFERNALFILTVGIMLLIFIMSIS